MNKPEVFEKKQFEFKNCVSPTYIDNLVINEDYFDSEEQIDHDFEEIRKEDHNFEDADFNPFNTPLENKPKEINSIPSSNPIKQDF